MAFWITEYISLETTFGLAVIYNLFYLIETYFCY